MVLTSRLLTLVAAMLLGMASSGYGQDSLTNGLVAYYPFNGSAQDESGNRNHGVARGASLATNRFGLASVSYAFAKGSYVETLNSVGFPISTNDFTVSVWLSISAFPSPQADAAMIFANKELHQFQLGLKGVSATEGFLDFWTGGHPGGPPDCHTATNTWKLDTWYNVVVMRSQNIVSVYRDGIIVGQNETTFGNTAGPLLRNLEFGYRSSDRHGALFGQLDEIRIYSRALLPAELQHLTNTPARGLP